MNITYSMDLKKAVIHYQNKLKDMKETDEKDSRLRTVKGKEFIDKALEHIPALLDVLGEVDRVITIYETNYPEQKTFACLALRQYIKDLEFDITILENKLSFKSEHFQKITHEIEIAKHLQKECGCET